MQLIVEKWAHNYVVEICIKTSILFEFIVYMCKDKICVGIYRVCK